MTLEKLALPPDVARPLVRSWTEAEAFAYCTRLTKGHYENFPVGSALIPEPLQPAVHSLYAFMRTADDFSDENRQEGDETERLAQLNAWEELLNDCEQGKATHPIFIALSATLRRHQIPAPLLHDLLHAFKMDVTVRRYATFEEVLTYCRYSANPVGRLILSLFGYHEEALFQLSDNICTALQLANHWQDVSIDLDKDRIYLPQDSQKTFGVTEDMLFRRAATPEFKRLLAFEVARARELFAKGRPLPEKVLGRLRYELRFTWHGGSRILDKIEKADYDVFNRRPVVTRADWLAIALRTLF